MPDFEAWDAIQERSRKAILYNFRDVNCLAAAAPTGYGKTRLGANLIQYMEQRGHQWIWYTHRKTLLVQTAKAFRERGLTFGIRASGHDDEMDITLPGQVAMIQSEKSAIKKGSRDFHDARFVVIDEAHANKTGFADELIKHHVESDAKVLLLSATPVGLVRAERLITLAHLSEMRRIGALMEAVPYTVPEQDMKMVKRVASGDFSSKYQAVHFTRQAVVGNILHHYHRLQQDHFGLQGGAPCLAFAPCVKSSISMTDQFNEAGVKSAHIDGEDVYLGEHDTDGEPVIYQSNQNMRQYVFDEFEAGRIKVIWNRFVMREGVDLPSIGHVIVATSVGTPETWVQMIGRGLRSHESLDKVIIQDHGGNCNRPGLGGPNQDREWELEATNKSLVAAAKEREKKPETDKPKSCPNQACGRIFMESKWKANLWKCPACGKASKKQVVTIIEEDGTLRKFYPKSPVKKPAPPAQQAFTTCYFSALNGPKDLSFHQIGGIFHSKCPDYEICKETGRARNRQTLEVFELYYCPKKHEDWDLAPGQIGRDDMKWPPKGGE